MTTKRTTRAQLEALPFLAHQKGHAEYVARFHVDDAEAVLSIMKPYLKRTLSDAERARLREIGARGRRMEAVTHARKVADAAQAAG